MGRLDAGWRANARSAAAIWGRLAPDTMKELKQLTRRLALSVRSGELLLLGNKWYVTHSGLLRIAQRRKRLSIKTLAQAHLSDPQSRRWVFKATVCMGRSRTFVGYGDADPLNVNPSVSGAEMRVAETRAVNRALRKALGIGLCSFEELGWTRRPEADGREIADGITSANGHNEGPSAQPRLRDRLSLLIRQHRLDAGLVKAYASDYCGTPILRDASRESIEAFINHLAEKAVHNREGLLCQLNSYAKVEEAKS